MFLLFKQIGGLSVKNQIFGLVDNATDPDPFDGLIGISYPLAGAHDNSTIIDRLFEQGQIKKRVSCVKLRASYRQEASEYIIGGCDVENVSWIPVVKINGQYTGWRVNLTKVILRSTADNSELLTLDTNNLAVMDTGASDIIGNGRIMLICMDNGTFFSRYSIKVYRTSF